MNVKICPTCIYFGRLTNHFNRDHHHGMHCRKFSSRWGCNGVFCFYSHTAYDSYQARTLFGFIVIHCFQGVPLLYKMALHVNKVMWRLTSYEFYSMGNGYEMSTKGPNEYHTEHIYTYIYNSKDKKFKLSYNVYGILNMISYVWESTCVLPWHFG